MTARRVSANAEREASRAARGERHEDRRDTRTYERGEPSVRERGNWVN